MKHRIFAVVALLLMGCVKEAPPSADPAVSTQWVLDDLLKVTTVGRSEHRDIRRIIDSVTGVVCYWRDGFANISCAPMSSGAYP